MHVCMYETLIIAHAEGPNSPRLASPVVYIPKYTCVSAFSCESAFLCVCVCVCRLV